MLPFSYEDRFPASTISFGYGTTNEEPPLIKDLLKPFKRGLGIASGGEVAFFALLPRTRESLTLIDHSYVSLRAFCLKSLLVATLGPVETQKLLIAENPHGWKAAIEKVHGDLPAPMQTQAAVGTYGDTLINDAPNVRREWHYADPLALKRLADNLHKVNLIHGDLSHAADQGPFDLLYLSNALEHTCDRNLHRDGAMAHPDVPKLTSLIKPKGQVVWVQAQGPRYGANKSAAESWPVLKTVKGYRTSWLYNLASPTKLKVKAKV